MDYQLFGYLDETMPYPRKNNQNDLIIQCMSQSECNDFFKLINSYLNGSKTDCEKLKEELKKYENLKIHLDLTSSQNRQIIIKEFENMAIQGHTIYKNFKMLPLDEQNALKSILKGIDPQLTIKSASGGGVTTKFIKPTTPLYQTQTLSTLSTDPDRIDIMSDQCTTQKMKQIDSTTRTEINNKIDDLIKFLLNVQFRTLFGINLPVCLTPRFITDFPNEAASTIPLDEFPKINWHFFIK